MLPPRSCSPTCSPTSVGWSAARAGSRRPTARSSPAAPLAADVPPELRWSPAYVLLLDQAAELLGDDGAEAAAREAAALREEISYAQGVLDVLDLEEDLDPELLRLREPHVGSQTAAVEHRLRHLWHELPHARRAGEQARKLIALKSEQTGQADARQIRRPRDLDLRARRRERWP